MKLVLFTQGNGSPVRAGALVEDGIAELTPALAGLESEYAQRLVENIIDAYDERKPEMNRLIAAGSTVRMDAVYLQPPLPRPSKILCCIGNYWEHAQREPRPLNMFLKSPEAVIGPGDTIVLPRNTDPYVFQHEAELAIVFKGLAKDVDEAHYLDAVFGYTCLIDVSAREEGRKTWRAGSWMGKSFDTFAPIGPCVVTADEIPDPNALHVQFWNDGDLRHDYTTDDMEHYVPELVAHATGIMTMNTGDVLSCGTNHEGLGPVQDGETVEIEIQGIGRMTLSVSDPLKRTWERGIYMGEGTTYRGPT